MSELQRADGRRSIASLVAAGMVVVTTVIVVLVLGVARPPELALLGPSERPERSLAVFAYRDRGQCLDVVTPQGQVREVRCGLDGVGPAIAWDEVGIVVLRYDRLGEVLETLDPVTGEVVARETLADGGPQDLIGRGGRDGWVSSERDGGRLTVRDADGRILWIVAAPESYRVEVGALDAATGRRALVDSARRLLLLEPGAAAPRIWVEDLGTSYAELIWEGTERAGR
jgi:hypothetical protein